MDHDDGWPGEDPHADPPGSEELPTHDLSGDGADDFDDTAPVPSYDPADLDDTGSAADPAGDADIPEESAPPDDVPDGGSPAGEAPPGDVPDEGVPTGDLPADEADGADAAEPAGPDDAGPDAAGPSGVAGDGANGHDPDAEAADGPAAGAGSHEGSDASTDGEHASAPDHADTPEDHQPTDDAVGDDGGSADSAGDGGSGDSGDGDADPGDAFDPEESATSFGAGLDNAGDHDGSWHADEFPAVLDLGGEPPEPVDGFPWADPDLLGQPDPAQLPDFTAGTGPGSPDDLLSYAGLDGGGDGDPWSLLLASDDPATSALARWWGPAA